MNDPIVVERIYNAPIEKVWKAITNSDDMRQWYFDLPGFKAEVGYEFQFTGGPDEKKGERLLVLHTLGEDQLKGCLERLDQAGLPNLWVPRPQAFFKVDAIPYLGTGKLDLRKVRELALQLASA